MPNQERTFRSEAIVISHKDWGEADRMLWLYTRKLGKVQAIAKGVRKMRSRKAGHLEPFTCSNLMFARGRTFLIVTQAETVAPFLDLREDLLKVGYAAYISELLDRFTYEEDDNHLIYQLLKDTLTRIDGEPEPYPAVRYFEIHLLDLLGYKPELTNCVNCDSLIQPEDQFFSISLGGVVCPRCGSRIQDARPISMNTLKYLRHFQRSSYREATRATLPPELNRDLEQFMQRYITYILERDLNTPAFISRIKDNSGTN
ncbi:MAG: DNA repair protein RecO [Anaerolineales bacterium]|nr:DNA repair protein RecO [Anaerolineales bacterium]